MKDEKTLIAFEDPNHQGNSLQYHTGKSCVVVGCDSPAGTAWSPLWCFEHNVQRMRRITTSLEQICKDITGDTRRTETG